MVLFIIFLLFFFNTFFFPEQTLPQADSPATELSSSNERESFTQKDRNVDGENLLVYPYEHLRVVSANPVTGIDITRREVLPELKKIYPPVFSHSLWFFFLLDDHWVRPINEIANSRINNYIYGQAPNYDLIVTWSTNVSYKPHVNLILKHKVSVLGPIRSLSGLVFPKPH